MTRNVDPEEFLKKFTLRPVPPGLREKIFPLPEKRKRRAAFWTPLQGKTIVTFLILGISAVLIDTGLARFQKARLAGWLNPPAVSIRESGSGAELLSEIWSSRAGSAWIEERLKMSEKSARQHDRRELFLFLKEEFNGS
jgi:hypothetical protein